MSAPQTTLSPDDRAWLDDRMAAVSAAFDADDLPAAVRALRQLVAEAGDVQAVKLALAEMAASVPR